MTTRYNHAAELETVGRHLIAVGAQVDELANQLDAWHWDHAGAVIVAPHNRSDEIARAVAKLTAAAGMLARAGRAHHEAADRERTR